MSLIKSLQKKLFGKGKCGKHSAASPTAVPSATPPAAPTFESDILKKELPSLEALSREELAELLKTYASDYSAYAASCKGNARKYVKRTAEKLEEAHKQEAELELLRTHNEKLQEQQRKMVEENDATISSNNTLKEKVTELDRLSEEAKTKDQELESMKQSAAQQTKLIEQLRTEMKKKDKLIEDYDDKFEQLEEKMQSAIGRQRSSQTKASSLDEQLGKMQKEIEELHKENQILTLAREREASAMAQERVELKKAVSVLEKNLAHLTKEKAELERRTLPEKPRMERIGSKKSVSRETQTEHLSGSEQKSVEDARLRANLKDEELTKLQRYSGTLKGELDAVKDRLVSGNSKVEELTAKLAEQEKKTEAGREEVRRLVAENADLKKRREAATQEINKLTQQLLKRGSRIGESTPTNSKEAKDGKTIRHLSEAIISTKESKGTRAMTGEQEIILSTKKDLELLYKDFIRCVFHEANADKSEVQRLAGNVDLHLNGVIERLTDYCEEQIEPIKACCPAFVAKLKKEKEPPKPTVAFMPPPPEQPFTKRVAQMQVSVALGKTPASVGTKSESPTKKPAAVPHGFSINGKNQKSPCKALAKTTKQRRNVCFSEGG